MGRMKLSSVKLWANACKIQKVNSTPIVKFAITFANSFRDSRAQLFGWQPFINRKKIVQNTVDLN